MNDRAGPNDIVSALLVFVTLTKIPIPSATELQNQENMEPIDAARKDFLKVASNDAVTMLWSEMCHVVHPNSVKLLLR